MRQPTFLIPANKLAPSPIVPRVPNAEVSSVTPCTKPFKKFTAVFRPSDVTNELISSFHEFWRAFNLP